MGIDTTQIEKRLYSRPWWSARDLMERYRISRSTFWRLASAGWFGTPFGFKGCRGTRWCIGDIGALDNRLLTAKGNSREHSE